MAHYAQATDDAYELDDHRLTARAAGHAAQLAIAEGQPAAALRRLDETCAADSDDRALTGWRASIQTEARMPLGGPSQGTAGRVDHSRHCLADGPGSPSTSGSRLAPADLTVTTPALGRFCARRVGMLPWLRQSPSEN